MRIVGRVLFHKVIWHHHHIVIHVRDRSRVIDWLEIGGHVGHGNRVETLHDCVLVYSLRECDMLVGACGYGREGKKYEQELLEKPENLSNVATGSQIQYWKGRQVEQVV